MGSYLSEPAKEKVSFDEDSTRLSYGSSSMQGWRVSQEDSHNSIIDFDTDTSFFAVYDGHGGGEVAKYCSLNLPDCLRSTSEYKKGNVGQALEDAFLEFDACLIKPEVLAELKQMAGIADSDDSEEDTQALREEASLPLDEVLARYGPHVSKKVAPSPMLKAKTSSTPADINGLTSMSSTSEASASGSKDSNAAVPAVNGDIAAEKDSAVSEKTEVVAADKTDSVSTKKSEDGTKEKHEVAKESKDIEKRDSESEPPSEVQKKSDSKENVAAELVEAGCSSEGSGKRKKGKSGSHSLTTSCSSDEDDEECEEDEEYNAKHDSSSADEEEEDNKEEDTSDEEEDDEESESDESEGDEEGETFYSTEDEPGIDCGCTAVVAVLQKNQLYVANAGDSRCIVSRGGKAIELSFDHKPEDPLEKKRIYNAGGRISEGRVNGGLNLSRAIGDHTYKRNEKLSPKEQMITALPDIQTLVLDPKEDSFMVLACDGIWNLMSSQEVVDFVEEHLKKDAKLSAICEELFEHCLAPDTLGDGTGCDNMTAIIVKFGDLEAANSKRKLENEGNEERVDKSDLSEPSSSTKKRKVNTAS